MFGIVDEYCDVFAAHSHDTLRHILDKVRHSPSKYGMTKLHEVLALCTAHVGIAAQAESIFSDEQKRKMESQLAGHPQNAGFPLPRENETTQAHYGRVCLWRQHCAAVELTAQQGGDWRKILASILSAQKTGSTSPSKPLEIPTKVGGRFNDIDMSGTHIAKRLESLTKPPQNTNKSMNHINQTLARSMG